MIIHKHKFIYIHIPKCGGWSVESAFLNEEKIERDSKESFDLFHIGGNDDKAGRYTHMMLSDYDVPDGYKTFALIREPISRAISYYNWFGHKDYLDFLSFCKSLPAKDPWNYMMTRPQVDYLEGGVDKILRLGEHASFFKEKFGFSIPHINKSKKREAVINNQTTDILNEYYREDFELWNQ